MPDRGAVSDARAGGSAGGGARRGSEVVREGEVLRKGGEVPREGEAVSEGLREGDAVAGRPLDLSTLRHLTAARIALGRAGAGIPTRAEQSFLLDHARARAAVWSAVDWDALARRLAGGGLASVRVASQAPDRAAYVRRPDLGRRLDPGSGGALTAGGDVCLVIGDGLSATAIELNAAPLALALSARLGLRGPVVLAQRARVALADEIGAAVSARLTIMLIGERPGLSAADSLGAYLTYDPRPGTPDSRRNCVSNIREGGLPIERAADLIAHLVRVMLSARLSGVALQQHLATAALPGRQGLVD